MHFLEVHLVLQLAQHDVVDEVLVSQGGDFPALVFEHAQAHPSDLLLALDQVVVRRTVLGGLDQRGLFFVLLLQPPPQVVADADFVGDRWQRVEGGLNAPGAGQLQFLGRR